MPPGARAQYLGAELVAARCLARIDADRRAQVQAWALPRPGARARAGASRSTRPARPASPTGALYGLPVGVKDIIDTADMPTEDGTVLHAGRMPRDDAARGARGCARPARS